ncbi:MAG: urease accessory protein UreD [Pseudomonadota bacterium]
MTPVALQRTTGRGAVGFKTRDGKTVLDTLHQQGAAKIRLPKPVDSRIADAVLINTSGGLTGGDRLDFDVNAGPGTHGRVATQASEKVYRASSGVTEVVNRITIGPAARLDWLPQETILFDRSALSRSLTVDMAADAIFLAVESTVFGRAAMGEILNAGFFSDRWRIRHAGELVFADETRLHGGIAAKLNASATGAGCQAVATLVYLGPDVTAAGDRLQAAFDCDPLAGASAWGPDGRARLVSRMLAPTGQALREKVAIALQAVDPALQLPKVWMC